METIILAFYVVIAVSACVAFGIVCSTVYARFKRPLSSEMEEDSRSWTEAFLEIKGVTPPEPVREHATERLHQGLYPESGMGASVAASTSYYMEVAERWVPNAWSVALPPRLFVN